MPAKHPNAEVFEHVYDCAVRGKRTIVAASSPEKLTEQVEAMARGEAGPDEGDKTQTWRALRKHGRG
ncbi:MAG TPA: hypothetical protein VF933_16505 [Streptosporangiaceae bacterium]